MHVIYQHSVRYKPPALLVGAWCMQPARQGVCHLAVPDPGMAKLRSLQLCLPQEQFRQRLSAVPAVVFDAFHRWDFRRIEDICWIKTNRRRDTEPDRKYLSAQHQDPHSTLVHTKVRAHASMLVLDVTLA